jgi:hypothetical protein
VQQKGTSQAPGSAPLKIGRSPASVAVGACITVLRPYSRAIARTLKATEHHMQVCFIPPRAEPSVLDTHRAGRLLLRQVRRRCCQPLAFRGFFTTAKCAARSWTGDVPIRPSPVERSSVEDIGRKGASHVKLGA